MTKSYIISDRAINNCLYVIQKILGIALVTVSSILLTIILYQMVNEFRLNSLKEVNVNEEIIEEKEVCLKWQILGIDDEIADYIKLVCDEENVDVNLVLGILIQENPTFNPQIVHKNKNGTTDCGLFQLNSRYIKSDFKWRYWGENIEFDPFNYIHNSYIAIHHIKRLSEICDNRNEVIMSYNCGRTKVVNNKVPKSTIIYLNNVNKNIAMLNSIDCNTIQ